MRQFNTLTGFLTSHTSNITINSTVRFQGYDEIGDDGGADWKHNGVTGQTPSQSPINLDASLFNDGDGNQWAMLLSSVFEINTITELDQLDIGSIGKSIVCREIRSEYVLRPSSYTPNDGDITLSNGLVLERTNVPTFVVDEFPASPTPNTLYIKVNS